MESSSQTYRDQTDPINEDKRGRVIPASSLRPLRLALDNARVEVPFSVRGDFLFVDRASTGAVMVKLNNSGEGAMPFQALDELADIPIDEVLITHAAQPGLVLNLWYGYRARFRANSQTITSIGSITNAVVVQGANGTIAVPTLALGSLPVSVRDVGFAYGASVQSILATAALTPIVLVAPGVNVNGMIVWEASHYVRTGTPGAKGSILAKASAPATVVDGDVIVGMHASMEIAAGVGAWAGQLRRPVFIAAGKGLYQIADTLDTVKLVNAVYTLL